MDPPEVRRAARLLALSLAVSWIGVQISGAFSSVVVRHLTGDEALVGLPFFIIAIGSAVAAYPAGRLMDRVGRVPVLVVGHSLGAAGFTVGAVGILYERLSIFFLGVAITSLGAGATYLTRLAAADLYPAARRARGLALVVFSSVIGALLAVPLTSLAQVLGDQWDRDYVLILWSMGPIVALAAAGIVSRIRVDPKAIAQRLQAHEATAGSSIPNRPLEGWRPIVVAGLVLMLAQGAMIGVMSVAGASLEHAGHSPNVISITVAAHLAGMFFFAPWIGRVADAWGRRPILLLSGAVLAAATGAIVVAPHGTVYAVALFVVGLGWSFAFISASALVADQAPLALRGRVTGIVDFATAAFGAGAALTAGWALDHGGLRSVGVLGLVLAALIPIVASFAAGRVRPVAAPRLMETA